jgi:N-acetylglucosaminyldiphosphoundecaprenol N-acetyl-beta-D-mannosaminyltransferase
MKTDSKIPGPLDRKKNILLTWRRIWFEYAALLALEVLPRTFDITLSLVLIMAISPAIFVRALMAKSKTGRVFDTVEMIGRFKMPFRLLHFAGNAPGGGLAMLFNVLRGDMAFAGPRPMPENEASQLTLQQCIRFTLRPGLFSPFGLRRKVGIAYDSESVSDIDFYYSETVQGNMGLIARSLIGDLLAGGGLRPAPPILHFFGIAITNTKMDEAVDWMVKRVQNKATAFVAFVNPDCLNIAYVHDKYRQVLSQADRVLPDGIGINLGCRMMGVSLMANVNGTDLFPRLCERAAAEGMSLYLLGARPGVAETVARNMQERFPRLAIAGVQDGYFKPEETGRVIEAINQSQADILLVAFGAPKQEQWLAEHHDRLRPWVRVGVGGLFDFYSGRFPRAPIWMREIGLEWTWRLLQEPSRMWRRYLIGNPLFLYRVWLQKKDKENQQ